MLRLVFLAGLSILKSCVAVFAAAAIGIGLPVLAFAQGAGRAPLRAPTQEQSIIPQPRPEKQFPLGAAWSAVSVGGKPVSGERPSLLVDDQLRAKGFGGCNTYSATAYPLNQQGLAVGPVAVTRRACDGGQMNSERAFLVALRGARKWDLVEGRLVITGVAGEIRFERAL
jgi:heat shock protein HslJ